MGESRYLKGAHYVGGMPRKADRLIASVLRVYVGRVGFGRVQQLLWLGIV